MNSENRLQKNLDIYEQEPWLLDPSENIISLKESGEVIFELNCHPSSPMDRIRMERIVNAVNATAGIPSEQLSSDSFRSILNKVKSKRTKINK